MGTSVVPDHDVPEILRPSKSIEPSATVDGSRSESDWKATTPTMAELLCGVRDSPGTVGTLKSVAGDLCFILENCEVRSSSCTFNPRCLWSF